MPDSHGNAFEELVAKAAASEMLVQVKVWKGDELIVADVTYTAEGAEGLIDSMIRTLDARPSRRDR